jgi:hemoglobin
VTSASPKRDISSRADCERLVRAFYERAMSDAMIGYLFVDIAKLDLEAHVPVITSFWETVLLGTGDYRGGAFAPHARLNAKSPLRTGHFDRWVAIWSQTADELYEGPVAGQAKAHAARVARAFDRRLRGLPVEDDVAMAPLRITHHR